MKYTEQFLSDDQKGCPNNNNSDPGTPIRNKCQMEICYVSA